MPPGRAQHGPAGEGRRGPRVYERVVEPAARRCAAGLLVKKLQAEHAEVARLLALRIADAIDVQDTAFVASSLYALRCLDMTSACRRLAEQSVPKVEPQ